MQRVLALYKGTHIGMGGRVFQDGGKRKWPLFVKRKSEITYVFEAENGIPNMLRKRNLGKYQGGKRRWRERNQPFFMAEIENVTPSENLRISFSRKREY